MMGYPHRLTHQVAFCAICLAAFWTGCTREEPGTPPDPEVENGQTVDTADTSASGDDESASRLSISVAEMVDQAANPTPGQDYPPFLDRLPAPDEMETEAVENRHVPGQIDTMRTHIYEGVSIRVYDVSESESRIVTRIEVDEPGRDIGLPIDIGSEEAEVVEHLGEPEERRDGALRYHMSAEEDAPAAAPNYRDVYIDSGRVDRIVWEFYYD